MTAAILNITVGGSIFVLPSTLAASMGAMAPIAFLLGGVLFVPIVMCFAASSSRVTTTGGPYSYVGAAFGSLPALAIGLLLWVSSVAGSGGMSAALVDQFALLVPQIAAPLPRAVFLVLIYTILTVLNSLGVRAGATVIMVFAIAKLLPLLALATFGLSHVVVTNVVPTVMPPWTAIGTSLVLVVFAYSGLETSLAPSGEVVNPERNVPAAIIFGIGLVIVLYVALQIVAQGVLGSSLAAADAPLARVADVIVPGSGSILVLTASLSLVGTIQGDLLGSSRLLYALARDRFLPSPLAVVGPRNGVPVRAVAAHALVGCALAIAGSFNTLALISGGAFCLVYISCCAAAWRLQKDNIVAMGRPVQLPGGPLIPGAGIIGLLAVLATLHAAEWVAIGCAVMLIMPLYFIRQYPFREKP
jgi:APA family basic amino acid/polyamine antiporter